jgi:hypothetical protein
VSVVYISKDGKGTVRGLLSFFRRIDEGRKVINNAEADGTDDVVVTRGEEEWV